MKSSAVCLVEVGADQRKKQPLFSAGTFSNTSSRPPSPRPRSIFSSPFACEGGVPRDRLGRHVVVGVGAVEEGLPPLALGEGGVQGEARALQTQRGVTRRHAILRLVAGAQGRGGRGLSGRRQWKVERLGASGRRNLSASACVMEMRGGMRRGSVVGRDTLFRTSGERVRSRGRSQQGTWRAREGRG